jgi:RNA polymerase sigma-B factor
VAPDLRKTHEYGRSSLAVAVSERHEEEVLFERYHRSGDPLAREELVERCLPLARSLAGRYARAGESLEDLVQVANIGLIKAIDRFDPTRGIAFSSFAVPSILGELKRHFRDHGWAARVPRPLQERVLKVNTCSDRLASELGRPPKPRELARATGLSVEDVLEALEAAAAFDSMSLDAPVSRGDDESITYADSVGEVDPRLELVEYRSVVSATIRALPAREREVLLLRFGEDMTQSEIAARVGISQMHVSRLIRRSLERLQAVAAA